VTVLVTGDRGRLGIALRRRLEADGIAVRGFDAADGHDVLDVDAVREAARGCSAIVHLAGLAEDRGGAPERFVELNVSGTYHVLLAAREAGVERVVHASTGKVLGMLERDPAYVPIDDAHPGLPSRPYGLSKWLAEELCEAFTNETGIASLCLRPVLVLDDEGWATLGAGPELPEARSGGWHLGVFVDGEDVADAFALALRCPDPGHVRLLLCADEIASARPTSELVAERLPGVPWRDGEALPVGSHAALVDCAAARQVLGWAPRRGWRR
jgi:nucleoside-diphosphate-sugar epimerase